MRERPITAVPCYALLLLGIALAMQLVWHVTAPRQQSHAQTLSPPPSSTELRLASMGEPIALAKFLTLYVQASDMDAGQIKSLRALDYTVLKAWLSHLLDLDPSGQYPLFLASHIYAEISDQDRQREMLEFIYQRFFDDPNRRWASLAHAAVLAKHRLHDLPLARKYAHAIRLYATATQVPHWAQQMEVFILEDMNELKTAQIVLGALLETGQITDPHELAFLTDRLRELQARAQ